MRAPFKSLSRQASRTNGVTILVFCAVLLVLGTCGVWYWRHVETQTLLLQERNFRALTVTSHALKEMVINYENVFKSVIEGEPSCTKSPCPQEERRKAYVAAINALPVQELQAGRDVSAFDDVKVIKEPYEDEGFAVKFIHHSGKSFIKLTYVHQDRAWPRKTRWKVTAVMDIGPIMRQLVTEDIVSDVLLADRMGRVLYHHKSTHDPSGFEFEDVSALLHRINGSESKENGGEKRGGERNEDLVSTLPLFNEAPIGGIAHAIFAQATDLPADRGTAQTVILVGIIPAGQFHAEARAIALNVLLVMIGLMLAVFFVLPYIKLRTNAPTERLTPISVTVLIVSSILGVAVLTFGMADIATYGSLKQHLNARLQDVSEKVRSEFSRDVRLGLEQLAKFDQSCRDNMECLSSPKIRGPYYDHLPLRLCIETNKLQNDQAFSFFPTKLADCSKNSSGNRRVEVVYRDVESVFWVGSTGEFKVFQSHDPYPWKYVDLNEREYVSRIRAGETLIRERDGSKFWIQPIYSWTSGDNAAVLSMKSGVSPTEGQNPNRPTVAALEVKLPSVTDVGVPPGMGFAVIDQEGEVLFHSDARRNLRENFFKETNRDGRLRQAVFARVTTQFDGGYWGKDRHFYIAPLFPEQIKESPDVHWSLVTYWDIDMLRGLNLRALYSSGALFLMYGIIALSIAILGWWISSRANKTAYRWVWPQSENLHRYQIAIGLFVASLVAVGIWYVRPYSAPDMLLWVLLPALAAVVLLSIPHTKAHPTDHNKTDLSVRRRYRLAYALMMSLILLVFVVIPALVIFRVAVDVEWRLLAKFALFDLEQDRKLQEKKVRLSYPPALFQDLDDKGEVRKSFLQKFSEQSVVYADFPFESCRQESHNCREVPINVVQHGDERLIRWLYQTIDKPRIGQSGVETDIFREEPDRWYESEPGALGPRYKSQGTNSPPIILQPIPSPIPQWLYFLLVFGSLAPLAALRVKKTYVFAAAVIAFGGFLWFGLAGQALAVLGVLGVCALLYGTYYVLPTFAVQRVMLLDFPHPPVNSVATKTGQGFAEIYKNRKASAKRTSGLFNVLVNEMTALENAIYLAEIPCSAELTRSCQNILELDVGDDLDVGKEKIIREILEDEKITQYYMRIWWKRTESQHRSLFNLARDGFLHSRNPDIGPLLKNGLIVGDLNLRLMNESFRRFVIRTGLIERLDEDIAQARTSAWFQVWRPIGVGLVIVMVFLVLTQEQYRSITVAFLGVLPALLGAFSQAMTAPKSEKTASSA